MVSDCAPHSVSLVNALTRTPLCLLPCHFASPASFPRQLLSVPPLLLVPDRSPWRMLSHPRCSGVPRAPLPPLAHALVETAASLLGRPLLLLAVFSVADCPSLAGRAPLCSASPSLVIGPYIWLLHFLGTHYSIGISNCWLCALAVRVTHSMMAGLTTHWSRGQAPLACPHVLALGMPTLGKTHSATRYIIHPP